MNMSDKEELGEVEIFYGCVLFGKYKDIVDIIDYIKNFSDVKIVFDKKAPYKLFITEKLPKEAAAK
jgi:hypothetical protein